MIRASIRYTLLVSTLLFCACIEEVNFDVPDEFQDTTIIVGKIVKGNPSSVEVFIQKVFDFAFEGEVFVNAESVKVVNEAGDKLDVPISGAGQYKLLIDPASGFDVEVGSAYGLEVRLFDGQSFSSDLEVLVPVPAIGEIHHRLVNKEVINFENELEIQPRIEYAISTSLIADQNQQRTNIKWDFDRTYKQSDTDGRSCYIGGVASFDLIQIFNVGNVNTTRIDDYLVLEQTLSNTMVEGQYISVIQEALDEDALIFWEQAKALSTNSGTFYEPPPGQIVTNFQVTSDTRESIFGYFYATQHDTAYAFVDSTFINQFTKICPRPPRPGLLKCDDCCNCTQLENSKLMKPSFWTM